MAQMVKNLPAIQETCVWSLGWEDPLEKEMETHSSILAWKILWTEEPGRLQPMGLETVAQDWVTSLNFCLSFAPKYFCMHTKSLQSFPTLCDPMDCSLPCSSVHGILQARILEWVAISFSSGSSQSRDPTWVSCISCIGRWVHYH